MRVYHHYTRALNINTHTHTPIYLLMSEYVSIRAIYMMMKKNTYNIPLIYTKRIHTNDHKFKKKLNNTPHITYQFRNHTYFIFTD